MSLAELSLIAAVPFYVRVVKNDRIHLRYHIDARTVDDGRCGIDDNWVEISVMDIETVDSDRLCRFCFPVATGDKEVKE